MDNCVWKTEEDDDMRMGPALVYDRSKNLLSEIETMVVWSTGENNITDGAVAACRLAKVLEQMSTRLSSHCVVASWKAHPEPKNETLLQMLSCIVMLEAFREVVVTDTTRTTFKLVNKLFATTIDEFATVDAFIEIATAAHDVFQKLLWANKSEEDWTVLNHNERRIGLLVIGEESTWNTDA
jgi:hypothetical protein